MQDHADNSTHPLKVLLIRFSSFGDVVQSLSLPTRLMDLDKARLMDLDKARLMGLDKARLMGLDKDRQGVQIHWATKAEFVPLIENHPAVRKVWSLPKRANIGAVWRLCKTLNREHFDYIYDAHNSLRSRFICALVQTPNFLRKSQHRWKRFLLFNLRINLYVMPFSGQRDLLAPLRSWGLSSELPPTPQLFVQNKVLANIRTRLDERPGKFVALAPSAAYPLKRWPLAYWKELIQSTTHSFVILGGPEDLFTRSLELLAPDRVRNFCGQLSLEDSAAVIAHSQLLVSNDTGLLHVAEQLGVPCVALMGPAPFGFPSRSSTRILEMNLGCRPCSKHGQGPCINPIYQFCLTGISPKIVVREIDKIIGNTASRRSTSENGSSENRILS